SRSRSVSAGAAAASTRGSTTGGGARIASLNRDLTGGASARAATALSVTSGLVVVSGSGEYSTERFRLGAGVIVRAGSSSAGTLGCAGVAAALEASVSTGGRAGSIAGGALTTMLAVVSGPRAAGDRGASGGDVRTPKNVIRATAASAIAPTINSENNDGSRSSPVFMTLTSPSEA